MKKRLSAAALIVLLLLCGCAHKSMPAFRIKGESVKSIEIIKTCYDENDASARSFVSKTVTERGDIDNLISWLESLKLTRHDAIEIPAEEVRCVVNLDGVKSHRLIFIEGYVIFDATAYAFNDPSDTDAIIQKYNLLNYAEQDTELDLIK